MDRVRMRDIPGAGIPPLPTLGPGPIDPIIGAGALGPIFILLVTIGPPI